MVRFKKAGVLVAAVVLMAAAQVGGGTFDASFPAQAVEAAQVNGGSAVGVAGEMESSALENAEGTDGSALENAGVTDGSAAENAGLADGGDEAVLSAAQDEEDPDEENPGGEQDPEVEEALAAPENLAAQNVYKSIRLTWDSVEQAGLYVVERYNTNTQGWEEQDTIPAGGELVFTDTSVTDGTSYLYRVYARKAEDDQNGEASEIKAVCLPAPVLKVSCDEKGLRISWNRTAGSAGYELYRKSGSEGYKMIFSTVYAGEIGYTDASASYNVSYTYMVRSVNGDSKSLASSEKSFVRLSNIAISSFKRKNARSMNMTWKANTAVSGYQLQYGRNALFLSYKTVWIKNKATNHYTMASLLKNKTYWARIRSYKTIGSVTYYSPWTVTNNVYGTKTMAASQLKKNKTAIDIRVLAKQGVNGCSIMEGCCTDGTYNYYLLISADSSKNACVIVKVRQSTMAVVKISSVLQLDHGNDMAYDKKNKTLTVVHSTGTDPKKLSRIDPNTLKIVSSTHVNIPLKLAGGTLADSVKATSFSSLAYSAERGEYAVLLGSQNYNLVIMDSDFMPLRYVTVSKKLNYIVQGLDATADYILLAQSPRSSNGYNILTIYNWNGKYIGCLKVKKGYEIEDCYHIGSQFYVTFYRKYTVKVKKKVTTTVNGVKKTVTKKVKEVRRSDYVYKISFK